MLSQELEFSLNSAFQNAREKRHEFITVSTCWPRCLIILRPHACLRLRRQYRGTAPQSQFIPKRMFLLAPGSKIDTQPTIGSSVSSSAVLHVQAWAKEVTAPMS
jgi:ATP-dependent Clp protease ATP-binding subunit ClpA